MRTLPGTLFFFLWAFSGLAQAQTTTPCRVLLPSIADQYQGECKKGLAHGEGFARGKDTYKGHFVRGLPEGRGIYTWSTGEVYDGEWIEGRRDGSGIFSYRVNNADSVLTGYWKEDRYVGSEYHSYEYKVLEKRDIDDARFLRMDHSGDQVRIRFYRSGVENADLENLLLWGDSGYQSSAFNGFESITFPFSGHVTYTTINKLGTASLICKLMFVIYEPGSWEIEIQN
ncbi:MAG: hypothetical protein PHD61_02520 [Bacteroidales bacterium]|nr:hypothetical protein [Lentimicrobiaceae bacterium]MDD5694163.1 hypothetical protein [Bacteroidales bacterium]